MSLKSERSPAAHGLFLPSQGGSSTRNPSLPQRDCYVNVLRDAMAVDSLDPCGIYFGTTGGQVYASADSGNTWDPS
jgi:hypothetical protein